MLGRSCDPKGMLTLVFMQANFYHVQTVLEECTDSSGLALAWHVSNINSVLLICEYQTHFMMSFLEMQHLAYSHFSLLGYLLEIHSIV